MVATIVVAVSFTYNSFCIVFYADKSIVAKHISKLGILNDFSVSINIYPLSLSLLPAGIQLRCNQNTIKNKYPVYMYLVRGLDKATLSAHPVGYV